MSVGNLEDKLNRKYDHYGDSSRSIASREKTAADQPSLYKPADVTGSTGAAGSSRGSNDPINDMVRQNEELGNFVKPIDHPVMHKGKPAKVWQLLTSKGLRGKSSIFAVLLLLFGGGGFLTILFSPSLAIVQMKEVFTKSLNDQLHAVDARTAVLTRAKLKDVTHGSCGTVVIGCRFQKMSDNFAKKIEKTDKATVERAPKTTPIEKLTKSSRITKITFANSKGPPFVADTPEKLTQLMRQEPEVRAIMTEGYNPLFYTLYDKVAQLSMRMKKVTRSLKTTGDTDEERQRRINQAVSGVEDSQAKKITVAKDRDGNEVYTDENGDPVDKAQADAAREQAERVGKNMENGGYKGVLETARRGAGYLAVGVGALDSACTVFNTIRYTNALAKTVKKAQAARFAMGMILTPADSIKAGDAREMDVNFVGNNLSKQQPETDVIDESKMKEKGTADQPPTVKDPEAGLNAFDSPGYKIAAYGDAPDLSLRSARFMLGGGPTAIVDGVLAGVASVVTLGNPDPQAISDKCRYIQNPAVRFTGLAVGILAGVGSFGLLTAIGIGSSIAIAMTLPLFESQMADMLAGNVFKDISGLDSGDAGYVGSSAIFGDIAQRRGMAPVTGDEGIEYLRDNQNTYYTYQQTQQYIARATPFDVHNPHSFLGSIASTLVPIAQRSKASASVAMMNLASIIPTSFATLTKSAKAMQVNPEQYQKCSDPAYQSLGIKAGVFCEVHYWMSKEELAMDPVENANWMAANGEIDADSQGGDAKDNGKEWNYAKFLRECSNRTFGWGENQDENEGDGSNCVDSAKESKNKHYRVYTMDQSLQESMDAEPEKATLPGTSGFSDGDTGVVGEDGWAYPTALANTIIKGYRANDDPTRQGVIIAANNPVQTIGQPIFAAYDGTVIAAGPSQDYGNWIVIKHDVESRILSSVYGHMNDDGVLVRLGDTVKAGQQIGRIGSAQADQAYLYFELWQGSPLIDGQRIDPTPVLKSARQSAEAKQKETTSV